MLLLWPNNNFKCKHYTRQVYASILGYILEVVVTPKEGVRGLQGYACHWFTTPANWAGN